MLSAHSKKKRDFTDEDTHFLLAMGNLLSLAQQRQKSEEVITQSEQRYRTLFETAPDIITTATMDGVITSLNPAFETVLGYSPSEWIGKHFGPLLHPDDLDQA